jgi:DNA-nicking Smr family endonuclease
MKRTLTPEEKELWRYVTRHDKPLGDAKLPEITEAPAEKTAKAKEISSKKGPVIKKWRPGMHAAPVPATLSNKEADLSQGAYAGIDRSTAERFRKGDYPIDATLDLHGMTREKAHAMLLAFLNIFYAQDARCLLVITGKGKKNAQSGDTVSGVLRESLPNWLAVPELKKMILAFDVAKPKHGGSGAFYILLRRKR